MKTSEQIRDRIRGLLCEELDRRVSYAKKRLPRRCMHNYLHKLDVRKRVDDEPNEAYNRIHTQEGVSNKTLGLCLLGTDDPSNWGGTICEEPVDAQRCPLFQPKESKEQILEGVIKDLQDPLWVKQHMPDLAALVWVLDEQVYLEIPWWRRILFKILKINLEPLAPPFDPSKLLTSNLFDGKEEKTAHS